VFGQHNLFYVLFQILHKAGNGSFTLGQWLKVKLCKTKLNILKKKALKIFFFSTILVNHSKAFLAVYAWQNFAENFQLATKSVESYCFW